MPDMREMRPTMVDILLQKAVAAGAYKARERVLIFMQKAKEKIMVPSPALMR
jgi:hypothetical protein